MPYVFDAYVFDEIGSWDFYRTNINVKWSVFIYLHKPAYCLSVYQLTVDKISLLHILLNSKWMIFHSFQAKIQEILYSDKKKILFCSELVFYWQTHTRKWCYLYSYFNYDIIPFKFSEHLNRLLIFFSSCPFYSILVNMFSENWATCI